MASAAVESNRKAIIFDPFPTVVNPRNPKEFAFHPQVCLFYYCKMYIFLILLTQNIVPVFRKRIMTG